MREESGWKEKRSNCRRLTESRRKKRNHRHRQDQTASPQRGGGGTSVKGRSQSPGQHSGLRGSFLEATRQWMERQDKAGEAGPQRETAAG